MTESRPALHLLKQQENEEKRQRELSKQYHQMFLNYPKVVEDMLRDLGMNQDIDPRDIPANTLRNYGFVLMGKAGMELSPRAIREE